MKRSRLMAIILTGCMVLGNSNLPLLAAEQDELPSAEEVIVLVDEDAEGIEIQEDEFTDFDFADEGTGIVEDSIGEQILEIGAGNGEELSADVEETGILEEQAFCAEDADMTLPEIDLTTLKAEITDGKETAVPGDTVTVSVKVTDDRGIARVALNQFKPNRDTTGEITMKYNDATGLYECMREITDNTYPGEYSAYYLRAIDTNGNTTWLYYNQNDLSGCSYTVENANADMTLPEIDLTTLRAEITDGKEIAVPGDTVTVSVKVTDDRGIDRVALNQFKPNRDTAGESSMKYNDATGLYECTLEITDNTYPGEYSAYYLRAIDTNGNTTWLYYNQNDLSGCSYTVENANADMTLPEIDLTTLKAEITDGKETAVPGDTVTVSVKVTDDRGIARVALNQFKPNRDTTGEITMKYNDAVKS